MNLEEFKAWFDGFTESMDRPPNKKQWARIKERVAEITPGPATTYPVFVDRYWPVVGYPYWNYPYLSGGIGTIQATCGGINSAASICNNGPPQVYQQSFNSADAFTALGRMDAQAIN